MIADLIAECPSFLYPIVAVEHSGKKGLIADCRTVRITRIITHEERVRIISSTFLLPILQSAISFHRPQTQCIFNHLQPHLAVLHSSAIVSNQTYDDCMEMPPASCGRFEHLQRFMERARHSSTPAAIDGRGIVVGRARSIAGGGKRARWPLGLRPPEKVL